MRPIIARGLLGASVVAADEGKTLRLDILHNLKLLSGSGT
jgi:hypothetical protein